MYLHRPEAQEHLISILLEFECTNNIAEYEALVLGLHKSISLNVVVLKVIGDLEIMVWKVCDTIHYLSPYLEIYQQEIWRLISNFQALNIIFVPRMRNVDVDALTNAATRMTPLRDRFTVKICISLLPLIT